jgi:hypothetical protein
MAIVLLLSDRTPGQALPALNTLRLDLKVEPLSVHSLAHVLQIAPEALLVDAAENPGQGHAVLRAIAETGAGAPAVVAIVERAELERFAWHEVADELVYPGAPETELRLRLAMLRRRHGATDGSVVPLGPLALEIET